MMRTQKMAAKVFRLAQRVQKVQWQARAECFGKASELLGEAVVTLLQARDGLRPAGSAQVPPPAEDYGSPFTED